MKWLDNKKIWYAVNGIAFGSAIIVGVSKIIDSASFSNILWPFFAAMWVVVAFLNQLSIIAQQKIIDIQGDIIKEQKS